MKNRKDELIGFIFGCPFYETECYNCPFKFLMNATIEERIEIYNNLSQDEMSVFFSKHTEYYKKRFEEEFQKSFLVEFKKTLTIQIANK